MHLLAGPQDRICRTGGDAQRATDAPLLIYPSDVPRPFRAIRRVQGQCGKSCEGAEALYALFTTGWTLVDSGFARVYRGCVCQAVGVAAPRALRLRQCAVDGLYLGRDGGGRCHAGSFSARGASLLR